MQDIDQRLVNEVIQGIPKGYEALIDRYGRQVFALIAKVVTNPLDTEELAQDTFVKAFRHIRTFAPSKAALSTWLLRIAYHNAINHIKRRRLPVVSWLENITAHKVNPIDEEELDRQLSTGKEERIAMLEKAIDTLQAEERTLLVL